MANTLKFGNGEWATKEGSALAYNSENSNFKPLPFDFTRASTGTYVAKDGLIKTAASGVPRIDFLDSTSGSLKLEPQRTNLITYSSELDNAAWTKDRVTVSANQIASPDGSINADLIAENSENNIHRIYIGSISLTAGVDYTITVFAKKGNSSVIQLTPTSSSAIGSGRANFDLVNGILGTVSGGTASIEDYGNGWYRCSYTFEALATATSAIAVNMVNDDLTAVRNVTYSGNTNNNFYLFGAMLEQGSYISSYIKTSGSTATRVADACSQTVPDGIIGQTEGTLYFEGVIYGATSSVNRRIFTISDGTSTTAINLQTPTSNSKIEFEVTNGGITQVFIATANNSLVYGQNFKLAFGYKLNDFVAYMNGNQIGVDTNATVPLCNKISFDRGNDTSNFEGSAKQAKLYNTRLSNSELQALTTI